MYVKKRLGGFELAIKIMIFIFKIIVGIFIASIILPLKLLESRINISETEYIEVDFNEDKL